MIVGLMLQVGNSFANDFVEIGAHGRAGAFPASARRRSLTWLERLPSRTMRSIALRTSPSSDWARSS
jgi:hypothetical protein